MLHKSFYILATLVILTGLLGCGGRTGITGTPVSIADTGLSPRDFSLSRDGRVTWTNNTSRTLKVVSGYVDGGIPSPPPPLSEAFTIEEDGSFTPASKNLDLGNYEIEWLNSSGRIVTLQILDETGALIASREVANGAVTEVELGRVGIYMFYLLGTQTVTGTIIMSSNPSSDGEFESPYLSPGQTYSTVIDTDMQAQSYYVIDQADPNKSHIAGIITMQ